jgi:NAD-dependent dihydropyrimidine dehydrogenase PreA subunit
MLQLDNMVPPSYRMLYIGNSPAGLLGLDELLLELLEDGITPDDQTLDEILISGIKKNNFVPKSAYNDYAAALRHEFSTFYSAKKSGTTMRPRDYGTWEGHPRENIPWFPTIAINLCNGCAACIEVCPKEVFKKESNGKVIVVDPFACIVGCCFCKSPCLPKAIMMPEREMLDGYRHNH